MTDTVSAVARHEFATLTPKAVYDAWLDAGTMRHWMEHHLRRSHPDERVTRIELNPVVGGRFDLADTREGSEAWGYYRALERPGRIVFTWFVTPEEEAEDNSLVTIEISQAEAGCSASISHEMGVEWADYVEPTAKAWKSMLEAMDAALAGRMA